MSFEICFYEAPANFRTNLLQYDRLICTGATAEAWQNYWFNRYMNMREILHFLDHVEEAQTPNQQPGVCCHKQP